MSGQMMNAEDSEVVIPARVLRGTLAERIAELDSIVVGLVALRRHLASDELGMADTAPRATLPREPERVKLINWPWRRLHRPGAVAGHGGRQ